LRLQANREEEGFNTDDGGEADNKDGVWTHSLRVSDLVAVEYNGVWYYEIRLDLNEGNAGDQPQIALEELQLFYSGAPATGADYANGFSSLNKVFDLSGSLNLTDISSGSGTDDYRFLIPASLFPDPNAYFTLYSRFSGSDGGFEEWRALANNSGDGTPAITLVKTADPVAINEGTSMDVTYTYTLTSQSSATDPLTLTSFVDDNGTTGDSSDDINLLFGASGTNLGTYYVSGDTNGDGLLQNTETWIFRFTRPDVTLDPNQTLTNLAAVNAVDDEGNNASDTADATVTGQDVLPAITITKVANPVSINEGVATDITYTYTITSQSASTDPLTLTSLMDDSGTIGFSDDDINLLFGASGTNLGTYYVSGDTNMDGKLQNTETWVFSYTRPDLVLNGNQSLVNTVTVAAQDDEGNSAGDTAEATVTGTDVLPGIGITKTASTTSIQAGTPTPVTFTYTLTNLSTTPLDPLTLTSLRDDMGTAATDDDVNLLPHYTSGDDGDGLLEVGETWNFSYTAMLTLNPGETRTNVATVYATDDEGNSVHASDDAAVTGYNLGRTPGFWSNNGASLWDGNTATTRNDGLGIVPNGQDLAYRIYDLNGDGDTLDPGEAAGSRQFLMIGDWDKDGIADANENVLVISRADALSLLNSSLKQQQDGRYVLARDVVASWLNYLGGSYVGISDDPNSAMHYIDEATAWLRQTTNGDNRLQLSELTAGTKVAQSSSAWAQGFDYDLDGIRGENMVPLAGEHDLGPGTSLDILGGSAIHSGLDHYNNHGFI
jgi:hypothetical protein